MVSDMVTPTRLIGEISDISLHDHACLIYDTELAWFSAVIPFIVSGLSRGERCICCVGKSADEVLSKMRQENIDIKLSIDNGALIMLDEHKLYLRNGLFNPSEMIFFTKEAVELASKDGFNGLRVASDMSWMLDNDNIDISSMMKYEAMLNDLMPSNDIAALCQYDSLKFSPNVIRDVIRTHPFIVHMGSVHKNPFFVTSGEFLSVDLTALEVKKILSLLGDLGKAKDQITQGRNALTPESIKGQSALDSAHEDLINTAKLAALGRMGVGIAHQLSSPLSACMLLTDVLVDRCCELPEQQKSLQKIRDILDGMRNTIRCMLFMSGVHGKKQPELTRIDVNDVVVRVLSIEEVECQKNNIQVVKNLDPGLICIDGYVGEIDQVILNLFNNAIDAMSEGGILSISTRLLKDVVEMQVGDTGRGIPTKDIGKIFEPFFTTKLKQHGMGLGLSIVSQVVRKYGGAISVKSEEGRGSEFTVRLPVSNSAIVTGTMLDEEVAKRGFEVVPEAPSQFSNEFDSGS